MVNPSPHLDLIPQKDKPHREPQRQQWLSATVVDVQNNGTVEIRLDGMDVNDPTIITTAGDGIWAKGAATKVLTDASGRILVANQPDEVPTEGERVYIGQAAKTLDAHEQQITSISTQWQSELETVKELAQSAPAQALDAARAELGETINELKEATALAVTEVIKPVTAEKIVASEELWAKLAKFGKVTTPMLLAGQARITDSLLADNIVLKTNIIAGNPEGTHTRLDPRGLHVYRRTRQGQAVEAIRLGTNDSEDYLGISNADGQLVSSLDAEGGAAFQTLNAGTANLQHLTLAGLDVAAALAGSAQAASFVSSTLNQPAFKSAFHAAGATVMVEEHVVSNPHDYPLFALYVASSLSARIETTAAGKETWGHLEQALHYVDRPLGTQVQPSINSPVLSKQVTTNQGSGYSSAPMLVPFMVPPKTTRCLMLSLKCVQSRFSIPEGAYSSAVVVFNASEANDSLPGRVIAWATDTQYRGYTPPPAKQRFVREYAATWGASYNRNAGGARHGAYDSDGVVVQGKIPGINYLDSGLIGFPDMTRDLAGANVEKVEVYLYFTHWYSGAGGVAGVGTHNALHTPGSLSGGSRLATLRTARSAGGWVTLPSSVNAQFKSGAARGILLMAGSASESEYGLCRWRDARIRITFTK